MRKYIIMAALLLAAALVLSACGGNEATAPASAPPSANEAAQESAVQENVAPLTYTRQAFQNISFNLFDGWHFVAGDPSAHIYIGGDSADSDVVMIISPLNLAPSPFDIDASIESMMLGAIISENFNAQDVVTSILEDANLSYPTLTKTYNAQFNGDLVSAVSFLLIGESSSLIFHALPINPPDGIYDDLFEFLFSIEFEELQAAANPIEYEQEHIPQSNGSAGGSPVDAPDTAPELPRTPTTAQAFSVGDTVTLPNATLRVTGISQAPTIPQDGGGATIAEGNHTFLWVNFEVTAASPNPYNPMWLPNNFVHYVTAASGASYEQPFSIGYNEFCANKQRELTIFFHVPAHETIVSVNISDGRSNIATVNIG